LDGILRFSSRIGLQRAAGGGRWPGRIEFRPVERDGERGYDLRWSLVTKAILNGNIGMASPRGLPSFINQLRVPISGIAAESIA
jgi:hypothetical protein